MIQARGPNKLPMAMNVPISYSLDSGASPYLNQHAPTTPSLIEPRHLVKATLPELLANSLKEKIEVDKQHPFKSENELLKKEVKRLNLFIENSSNQNKNALDRVALLNSSIKDRDELIELFKMRWEELAKENSDLKRKLMEQNPPANLTQSLGNPYLTIAQLQAQLEGARLEIESYKRQNEELVAQLRLGSEFYSSHLPATAPYHEFGLQQPPLQTPSFADAASQFRRFQGGPAPRKSMLSPNVVQALVVKSVLSELELRRLKSKSPKRAFSGRSLEPQNRYEIMGQTEADSAHRARNPLAAKFAEPEAYNVFLARNDDAGAPSF